MEAVGAAKTLLQERTDTATPPRAIVSGLRAIVRPLGEPDALLAAAWDDLATAAAEPNVFAERWFVSAGARHLAQAEGVRLLELWDGARLVALLPLCIAPRYGRLRVAHVENWVHFHSFLGTPLIRAGHERVAWSGILAALDTTDLARGFLHFTGLVENGAVHRGLIEAAGAIRRRCDTVHRVERALLQSDLSPEAYYAATVRKKKRKEIKRLQARLAELGPVTAHRLAPADGIAQWCDAFLTLERSGWKGRAGSALASAGQTERFFRDAVAGAHAAGRLEMLRLDLGRRPIAMLVNFIAPPGAFSFKIAFDEAHARFSPGVLVQLENLAILTRPEIAWMDSCAVEDHPMINSLWGERRPIVRVTLPLGGWRRGALFHMVRAAENGFAAAKALLARPRRAPPKPQVHDD
ncbi:MAG: hypothetical protein JWM75_1668 [Sphingomonas bacterium]|nr:hypothetical protein [Sphingomonas bacterium]